MSADHTISNRAPSAGQLRGIRAAHEARDERKVEARERREVEAARVEARHQAEKWGERAGAAMSGDDPDRAMSAAWLAGHFGRKYLAMEEGGAGPGMAATFTTVGSFLRGQGRRPRR